MFLPINIIKIKRFFTFIVMFFQAITIKCSSHQLLSIFRIYFLNLSYSTFHEDKMIFLLFPLCFSLSVLVNRATNFHNTSFFVHACNNKKNVIVIYLVSPTQSCYHFFVASFPVWIPVQNHFSLVSPGWSSLYNEHLS